MGTKTITRDEAKAVLDAHLAYETKGGNRRKEWYAGLHWDGMLSEGQEAYYAFP